MAVQNQICTVLVHLSPQPAQMHCFREEHHESCFGAKPGPARAGCRRRDGRSASGQWPAELHDSRYNKYLQKTTIERCTP